MSVCIRSARRCKVRVGGRKFDMKRCAAVGIVGGPQLAIMRSHDRAMDAIGKAVPSVQWYHRDALAATVLFTVSTARSASKAASAEEALSGDLVAE